jgi:hypothetical protein
MKNVLMIAYDFPPANASGAWRPFFFARHLPAFGYRPLIVTQSGFLSARRPRDHAPPHQLDPCCRIIRVRPPRSEGGRPGESRAPRRGLGALTILAGLRFLHRYGYDLIWATGPPWSALSMGYRLSALTGKPLVADIRDPWTYGLLWNKLGIEQRRRQRWWQRHVLHRARRIIYTSPLTAEIMRETDGAEVADRIGVITNGFARKTRPGRARASSECVFAYVGKLERGIRDPSVLLAAFDLACRDEAFAGTARLQLVGPALGFDAQLGATRTGQIEVVGRVSYDESLRYMRRADVLVLFQTIRGVGADVIGGKAYEYLAARRPVLGVVPEDGGDAWLLEQTQVGHITGNSDPRRIADGFLHYWRLWKRGRLLEATHGGNIDPFRRRHLARSLAQVFDQVHAGT